MKKINSRLLFWLVVPALLFASCIMEINSPLDGNGDEGERVSVKVLIDTPRSALSENTASDKDENLMIEADILVFKEGSAPSGWIFDYHARGSSIVDAGQAGKKQFNVTLLSGDKQLLVVLANVADEINDLLPITRGTDRDVLLSRLVSSNQGTWPVNGNGDTFKPFPMWGEKEEVNINEQTVSVGEIRMMRAVSRIDVILDQAVVDAGDFQFKGVWIFNSKKKGYIVPDKNNIEPGPKVIAATVPPDPQTYETWNNGIETPLRYDVPTGSSELLRSIYLYEAKAATERDKATCLVVGGTYKGRPAWYRIDILDNGNSFMDILRNHLYRVEIICINGPGSETPEEAFYARKVDLTTEILAWNTGYMDDIIVSGQSFLKVTPSSLSLPCTNNDYNITVETNVGDWGVIGVTESSVWTGKQTHNVNWITITGGLSENRPAGTNSVWLYVDANESATARSAYLHIKAGRLLFPVKIEQQTTP